MTKKPLHPGRLGSPVTEEQLNESFNQQVRDEVKERNTYRTLLEECVTCLNQLENQTYEGGLTTYSLVHVIEESLKKFKA